MGSRGVCSGHTVTHDVTDSVAAVPDVTAPVTAAPDVTDSVTTTRDVTDTVSTAHDVTDTVTATRDITVTSDVRSHGPLDVTWPSSHLGGGALHLPPPRLANRPGSSHTVSSGTGVWTV